MIDRAQEMTGSLVRSGRSIVVLRLLRLVADRRARMSVGIASLLTVLLGINVIAELWPDAVPRAVAEHADLNGSSVGAVIESVVAIVAGGVALLLAAAHAGRRRQAWAIISACFLGFGIVDLFSWHPHGLAFSVATVGLELFVIALISHCVREAAGAARLVALGALLMLSNLVTEAYEVRLADDPSNYVYVADDQPFVFDEKAWRRLWAVSSFQETSEAVVMILLLHSFLLTGAGRGKPK